jgi:hypothetical protein
VGELPESSCSTNNGHDSRIVANVLDNGTHAELDKAVFESCMELSKRPMTEHLLANIVAQSRGTLDTKYGSIGRVQALLDERADLWQKLKDAWSTGRSRRSETS